MKSRWLPTLYFALLLSSIAHATRLDIIEIPGRTLADNPLHDPVARRAAVFIPDGSRDDAPLPIVYYLPGYGGSSEDSIAADARSGFALVIQKLADEGLPMRLVIVDCRNRWGGSQYLNSTAQGNYTDYVCDEIVPFIERRYKLAATATARLIAGHSSGGYGALMLGMLRQKLFAAVVALAPDSDLEFTHHPLIDEPSVRRVTRAELDAFMSPKNAPLPADGLVSLILGLSAAYAPSGPNKPGRFEWPWDEHGEFQPRVWQMWLDKDPLLLVRRNADAFLPSQRIYLDGGTRDEYHFNISARRIFDVLKERKSPATFFEPVGGHSDHLAERLQRGLAWAFSHALPHLPGESAN